MVKRLLGAAAVAATLAGVAAFPAIADPEPTPPPYCAGNDPGDYLNGVTCEEEVATEAPVSTRPSDPPPGTNFPGGTGTGPGGGGPGGGDGPGGGGGPGGG